VTTPVPENVAASNFCMSKGLTHDRVLIFPTGPIRAFLTKGTLLGDKSACGLYVGVTRAVHSVAFVMPEPHISNLTVWTPPS
jgi:DNA helicase II / ATP-dependent DNA helicase PcrA